MQKTTPARTAKLQLIKTIRPGAVKLPPDKYLFTDVFCEVEIKDGKLSITGVIGPTSGGNSLGGCGQISMEFEHRNPADNDKRYSSLFKAEDMQFAPGWTAELWLDFLDIWESWHLNDMRANCKHQIGEAWNTRRELTLYHFRLNENTQHFKRATSKDQEEALKAGRPFVPTPEQTKVALLESRITWHEAALPGALAPYYCPNGPTYPGDNYNRPSEVKTAGWVRPEEHPGGLLCKPCPVCGYKYGAEWKREELPASVVSFLKALPSADKTPAWV